MYVSKKIRLEVFNKFGGKCAYSGTDLLDDWQVDHVDPVRRLCGLNRAVYPENNCIDNMVPCQKVINHYKGSLPLDMFRTWYLGGLHERLKKLPNNPRAARSIKKKAYLLKVANFFGITPDKPFSGVFYFESNQ